MANGDVQFFLPGDPRRRFTPLTADVPDMPETLTLGDLYSPQQGLPVQQEKTFGEYLKEAGHGPVSFWTQRADLARNAQAMQVAPILMQRDIQRQTLAFQQQKEDREATLQFFKSAWDTMSNYDPKNWPAAIKDLAAGLGVKQIPNVIIKQFVEDAQTYPEEMAQTFQAMGLTRQAARQLVMDPAKFAQFRKEYAPKEYAPTREIMFVTKAARSLGMEWKPGQPVTPDVADKALELELEWNERNRVPLGDEARVFYEELKRTGNVQMAQDATINYTTRKAGGRGFGGAAGGFQAGFTPPGQLPAPPTFAPPGAARPPVTGPASSGPSPAPTQGPTPGTSSFQRKATEQFLGQGLPAETQDVIAGFDNISALMQQIRGEFTPQELRRYVGFINKPAAQVAQVVKDDPKVARFLNLTNQARMMAFDLGGKQLTPMEKRVVESILPMGTELSFENFMANIKGTEERITRLRDSRIKSATTTRGEALRGTLTAPKQPEAETPGPTMSPVQQRAFEAMPEGARIRLGGQFYIKRNGKLIRPK